MMNPSDWATPAKFRENLLIDADGELVKLGPRLEAWQREQIFEPLDPAWQLVAGVGRINRSKVKQRAWIEMPRGHGKTFAAAVQSMWALIAARRRISGIVAAVDRDQAGFTKTAIETLVRLNGLDEILDVQGHRVLNKHTGSELTVIASDAASSWGLLVDYIVADEVGCWPKRDLWDSLISTAAKKSRCYVCALSNAGFGETWNWNTREACRTDPDWHFARLDGPKASWISEKALAEQLRQLPDIAYRRLWLNQWTTGSGDALTEDEIDAALMLDSPLSPRDEDHVFVAGLDIGVTHDRTGLVVLGLHVGHTKRERVKRPEYHNTALRAMSDLGLLENRRDGAVTSRIVSHVPGDGRMRLAYSRAWKPERGSQVQLEDVMNEIARLRQLYNLRAVAFDPSQAIMLAQMLRKQGVQMIQVDQTGKQLQVFATELLEAFRERQLLLTRDEELLRDLRALRVEERSYGYRLTSPRDERGHGDLATALQHAIFAARRAARTTQRINRPLMMGVYP